jgi:hypothetical protein
MIGRIVVAGLAGALAMFVWTAIAHLALPLGSTGFSQLQNEEPARAAMQAAAGRQSGLYLFPYMDPHNGDYKSSMAAYTQKARTGPSGLLLYRPPGGDKPMGPGMLLQEFLKQVVVCVIAAFLLAEAKLQKVWERAGFVAAIGVVASLETNASYRIWYGFPGDFTAAAILTSFVSYVVAGFAIAWIVDPKKTPKPLAT